MTPPSAVWHSLKTRITAATLLIFVASLWSLTLYQSHALRLDMQRQQGEQQAANVQLIAADLDRELSDRLQALAAVAQSLGPAVQGSPVNAVVWLANTLGRLGIPLKAGEVILSGSQSPLVPVQPGDSLHCSVGGLGNASVRFI